MTRLATTAIFVALIFTTSVPLRAADQIVDDSRIARLDRWLHAVVDHVPGDPDGAVIDISSWSNADLDLFRFDVGVLTRLMRDLRLTQFQLKGREVDCIDCFAARRDTGQNRLLQPPQNVRYSDAQLHRLRTLACASAGRLDDVECIRQAAERELDAPLRRLATLAASARRRGDSNFMVRRATLLQTDVAMATANAFRPVDGDATGSSQPVRLHMVDGEAAGVGAGDTYWAIARDLVDAIMPRPDTMSRRWYIATNAWMQEARQYNPAHLERARALFPDDPIIALLRGTQAEVYASPPIQLVARGAILPTGFVMEIGSEGAELRTAETFLQRAVRLDPSSHEAHLHFGHVLFLRGKAQEAVAELAAASMTLDPLLRYYADLFRGAAEESLAHLDLARAAYEHAAMLFPHAQSPALALSALAARRGDRAAALQAIDAVFARREIDDSEEPWWSYSSVQGRHADALLEELRATFREAQR